jgi:exopolysaccharide biosynthesis protein
MYVFLATVEMEHIRDTNRTQTNVGTFHETIMVIYMAHFALSDSQIRVLAMGQSDDRKNAQTFGMQTPGKQPLGRHRI